MLISLCSLHSQVDVVRFSIVTGNSGDNRAIAIGVAHNRIFAVGDHAGSLSIIDGATEGVFRVDLGWRVSAHSGAIAGVAVNTL